MFNLRPYQEEAIEATFQYLIDNPGMHPLVAMPTGSGKTVVLADIIDQAIEKFGVNVLVISHVKEIIEQDEIALKKHLDRKISVYSAGMNRREIGQVTVASIQSIHKKANLFESFRFIIIDECHLIPPSGNSMYRKFFSGLHNNARYFGLTATPYRLGTGKIYGDQDSIFDGLCLDLTSKDKFVDLINDGYLSPITPFAPNIELDTKNIRVAAGEFIERDMSLAFDRNGITENIVQEMLPFIAKAKKTLIFAIDIKHAEHIAEKLVMNGVRAYPVHSKMEDDRSQIIRKFKNGKFDAIVNVNILTTGFDDPEIDLICLIRPTKSPVLHVQMIGRGLRIFPGKDQCIVLDFAGNTKRLGPINDMEIKKKGKREKGNGEPMVKECPDCRALAHIAAKICKNCGYNFPIKTGLSENADNRAIIADNSKVDYKVTAVEYHIHNKKNSPSSLKVTYYANFRSFNEWICPQHRGFAKTYAKNWVAVRANKSDMQWSEDEIIKAQNNVDALYASAEKLAKPDYITVVESGKYPNIIKYTFS